MFLYFCMQSAHADVFAFMYIDAVLLMKLRCFSHAICFPRISTLNFLRIQTYYIFTLAHTLHAVSHSHPHANTRMRPRVRSTDSCVRMFNNILCMRALMHACTHSDTHAYIDTLMSHEHTCISIYVSVHICMCTYVYACVCVCMYIHVLTIF